MSSIVSSESGGGLGLRTYDLWHLHFCLVLCSHLCLLRWIHSLVKNRSKVTSLEFLLVSGNSSYIHLSENTQVYENLCRGSMTKHTWISVSFSPPQRLLPISLQTSTLRTAFDDSLKSSALLPPNSDGLECLTCHIIRVFSIRNKSFRSWDFHGLILKKGHCALSKSDVQQAMLRGAALRTAAFIVLSVSFNPRLTAGRGAI